MEAMKGNGHGTHGRTYLSWNVDSRRRTGRGAFLCCSHPRADASHAPRCIDAPELPPFTLQQLAALSAVVRCGGFGRGARALGMSQPSVTRAVRSMEVSLGCPIFDTKASSSPMDHASSPNRRGRGGLRLTEAGKLLYAYGERILSLTSESTAAIHDMNQMHGGKITLGASQTTGTYLMPKLIGNFHREYPHVAVALEVDSTRRICAEVERGGIDVAVVGGDVPRELLSQLVVTPYAEDEFALIMSTSHPLAKQKREIEKKELYDLDFVAPLRTSTVAMVQNRTLEQNGIDTECLTIVLEFNSIEAIKSAVQFDLGVAFVSTLSIQKELKLGLLQRVHVKGLHLSRSLRVVTSKERFVRRASKLFCKEVLFHVDETSWEEGFIEGLDTEDVVVPEAKPTKTDTPLSTRIDDLYRTAQEQDVASLHEIEDILLGDCERTRKEDPSP